MPVRVEPNGEAVVYHSCTCPALDKEFVDVGEVIDAVGAMKEYIKLNIWSV